MSCFVDLFQGETLKHIRFTIIDDVLPEVEETFTCLLTNVTNEAKLSNQTQVKVTIKASDKPFGVFVIAEEYRELAVTEPTMGYDGNFSVMYVTLFCRVRVTAILCDVFLSL